KVHVCVRPSEVLLEPMRWAISDNGISRNLPSGPREMNAPTPPFLSSEKLVVSASWKEAPPSSGYGNSARWWRATSCEGGMPVRRSDSNAVSWASRSLANSSPSRKPKPDAATASDRRPVSAKRLVHPRPYISNTKKAHHQAGTAKRKYRGGNFVPGRATPTANASPENASRNISIANPRDRVEASRSRSAGTSHAAPTRKTLRTT